METLRAVGSDEWTEVVSRSFYPLVATRAAADFSATLRLTGLTRGVQIAEVVSECNELVRTPRLVRRSPSDDVLILIQLAGAATVRQDRRVVVLGAGTATLCDPIIDYTVTADRPSHQLVLTMPRAVVRTLAAPVSATRARRIESSVASLRGLTALARESLSAEGEPHSSETDVMAGAILDLTRVMFARLTGSEALPASREALAQTARTYIREHAADPQLTVEQVAGEVGVSLRQLGTLFREDGFAEPTDQKRTAAPRARTAHRPLEQPRLDRANRPAERVRGCDDVHAGVPKGVRRSAVRCAWRVTRQHPTAPDSTRGPRLSAFFTAGRHFATIGVSFR